MIRDKSLRNERSVSLSESSFNFLHVIQPDSRFMPFLVNLNPSGYVSITITSKARPACSPSSCLPLCLDHRGYSTCAMGPFARQYARSLGDGHKTPAVVGEGTLGVTLSGAESTGAESQPVLRGRQRLSNCIPMAWDKFVVRAIFYAAFIVHITRI
jgi:hypothetical protein